MLEKNADAGQVRQSILGWWSDVHLEDKEMTKYQLAKLFDWTGEIDTRKRLQKIVYMLQAAGYRFDADYFLHRYGPYSLDVARLTDEMVSLGVLSEAATDNQVGQQYSYRLTDQGRQQLGAFKRRAGGKAADDTKFRQLAIGFAQEDLRKLEIASTIVYYHVAKREAWPQAVQSACTFKKISSDTEFSKQALALAQRIEAS